MQIPKEEFHRQACLLLPTNLVHLHNEFLLAILTKCQSVTSSSYVHQGPTKQKPTAQLPELEKKPAAAALCRQGSDVTIEIKPVFKTRPVRLKIKPLGVNFDVGARLYLQTCTSFNCLSINTKPFL